MYVSLGYWPSMGSICLNLCLSSSRFPVASVCAGCMECELGDNCRAGNKSWTQFCDNRKSQKFVWLPNLQYSDNQNYGSLKLAHFDLCLERMSTNTYQLQKCDPDSTSQVLVGWNPTLPFELHPIQNSAKCINQHHHPREEEDIANTACATAAKHHTNLWRVYRNENAGNEISRLRRPECSEQNPCNMCQGDCDNDFQCAGDLVCYQRGNGKYSVGFVREGFGQIFLPLFLIRQTTSTCPSQVAQEFPIWALIIARRSNIFLLRAFPTMGFGLEILNARRQILVEMLARETAILTTTALVL